MYPFKIIELNKLLSLSVIKRDPQFVCLALKSPPAKNFGPSVSENDENCSLEMECLGGQYRALTTIFDLLFDNRRCLKKALFIFLKFMVKNLFFDQNCRTSIGRVVWILGGVTFIVWN